MVINLTKIPVNFNENKLNVSRVNHHSLEGGET